MKGQFNPTHPAGIGLHHLQHFDLDPIQVKTHRSGFDAHHRYHAGGEACGHQVGGGETFTLSIIVNRGIGFKGRTAAQVGAGCPQTAIVNYRRSHYQ